MQLFQYKTRELVKTLKFQMCAQQAATHEKKLACCFLSCVTLSKKKNSSSFLCSVFLSKAKQNVVAFLYIHNLNII